MDRLKAWLSTQPGPRPRSNWAQIISVVISAVVLIGIFFQLSSLRESIDVARLNMRNSLTNQLYNSYRDASLRYPHLAIPDYKQLKSDRVEFARYKVFVGHMLWAYDDVLISNNNSSDWSALFKNDVRWHMEFLCEEKDPVFYEMLFPQMLSLLEEARAGSCTKQDLPR